MCPPLVREFGQAVEDLLLCDKARKVCEGAETPEQIRGARRYLFLAHRMAWLGHASEILDDCAEILRGKEAGHGTTAE